LIAGVPACHAFTIAPDGSLVTIAPDGSLVLIELKRGSQQCHSVTRGIRRIARGKNI
jgi:hypothetical protein